MAKWMGASSMDARESMDVGGSPNFAMMYLGQWVGMESDSAGRASRRPKRRKYDVTIVSKSSVDKKVHKIVIK